MGSAGTETGRPASAPAKPALPSLVAMVVGSAVGAGVFSLPGRFAQETGVAGALIAWVIAGSGMLMLALGLPIPLPPFRPRRRTDPRHRRDRPGPRGPRLAARARLTRTRSRPAARTPPGPPDPAGTHPAFLARPIDTLPR